MNDKEIEELKKIILDIIYNDYGDKICNSVVVEYLQKDIEKAIDKFKINKI